jgi:hypothetical protein
MAIASALIFFLASISQLLLFILLISEKLKRYGWSRFELSDIENLLFSVCCFAIAFFLIRQSTIKLLIGWGLISVFFWSIICPVIIDHTKHILGHLPYEDARAIFILFSFGILSFSLIKNLQRD